MKDRPRRDIDLNLEIRPGEPPRIMKPYDAWSPERALREAEAAGFQSTVLGRMPFSRLLRQSKMRRQYAHRVALYRQMTAEHARQERVQALLEATTAASRPSRTLGAVPTQRQPSEGPRESPVRPAEEATRLAALSRAQYQAYVEQVAEIQGVAQERQGSVFVDQTIRLLAWFLMAIAFTLLALSSVLGRLG